MIQNMTPTLQKLVAICCGVVVLAVGWRTWKEVRGREWLAIQQAYATDHSSFDIGIREIHAFGTGPVERCGTCHLEEFSGTGSHDPDLMRHHPVAQFGCVSCHEGNGLALDQNAHTSRWGGQPLLAGSLVESSCTQCHETPDPRWTPRWHAGKKLFDQHGCVSCHSTDGRASGSGPGLAGVGEIPHELRPLPPEAARRFATRYGDDLNAAYLHQSIARPQEYPTDSDSIMPTVSIDRSELNSLVVYLKSLRQPNLVGRHELAKRGLTGTSLSRGKQIAEALCVGCHGPGLEGGVPSPNAPRDTIPSLNGLSERLFLDEDGIQVLTEALLEENWRDALQKDSIKRLPRGGLIEMQLENVVRIIQEGTEIQPLDPNGPDPLDMPAWHSRLEEGELESLLIYMLSFGDQDEEDEEDEEDDEDEEDEDR